MEQLLLLDPADLAMLLAMRPMERLGGIIRLNRATRYANRLNAIVLLSALNERGARRRKNGARAAIAVPDSSPAIPGSSATREAARTARVFLPTTSKE